MVVAGYEFGKAYPDEPYEQTFIVKFIKKFLHPFDQQVIRCGEGNRRLPCDRIEIGITYFNRDATRKFVLLPELVSDGFGHADEFSFQEAHIGGIGMKGVFGRNGFLLPVRNHRRVIDTVRSFP